MLEEEAKIAQTVAKRKVKKYKYRGFVVKIIRERTCYSFDVDCCEKHGGATGTAYSTIKEAVKDAHIFVDWCYRYEIHKDGDFS